MLNLAINARDAMPDGGMLTIRHPQGGDRRRSRARGRHYIELSISDTGVGMTEEVARAPSSPSSRPRKSARAPASACRWSMAWRASRAAPRGSKASRARDDGQALFPPRRPRCSGRPRRRDRRRAAPGRRPATVLVIDDDPDVREFIAAAWRSRATTCARPTDGERG